MLLKIIFLPALIKTFSTCMHTVKLVVLLKSLKPERVRYRNKQRATANGKACKNRKMCCVAMQCDALLFLTCVGYQPNDLPVLPAEWP